MWAAPKIAEIGTFGYKFVENGYIHLNDFLQNLAWGGSPWFTPSWQILTTVGLKCGPRDPKIAKIGIFSINLLKRGIPLKRFLQNLAWWRESQVRILIPNFTVLT